MNKPWQLIVVLLGIFAAGGVTGGFVGLRVCKNTILNRPVPEEWAPKHIKRLVDRLDLTPEQLEQIRPIVHQNMEQLNRLRNHAQAETQQVVEGMQRAIGEKLTDAQRIQFAQMNRELRESREKREKEEQEKRRQLGRSLGEKPPEKPGDRPPHKDGPPHGKPPGN